MIRLLILLLITINSNQVLGECGIRASNPGTTPATEIYGGRTVSYDSVTRTENQSGHSRTFTSTARFDVNGNREDDINILKRRIEQLIEQNEKQKFEINQLENMLKNQNERNLTSICACDCKFHISDDNFSNRTNNLLQQIETSVLEKLSSITERTIPSKRHKRTRGAYVGCYKDSYDHRGLKGAAAINPLNSIESCISYCRGGNYVYAGLQFSNQCMCDNSRQHLVYNQKVDDSNCNMACPGNATQKCGDSYMNSIYETGIEQYLLDEEGQQLPDSYLTPHPQAGFKLIVSV